MDDIINSVEAYLDLNKTDYALQIDGAWGIGKTYFVKNELKKFIESKKHHIAKENGKDGNKDSKYKFIYISINGLKNVDEIGERILIENFSKYKTGYAITKSILKIGGGLVSSIPMVSPFQNAAETMSNELNIDALKLLNLKKTILCFDDLERIDPSVNIEELLGYINSNFVEHENVKTIIVSNQEKFNSDVFGDIKEKVIGRTLTFDRSITDILEKIIEDIYDGCFLKYLKEKDNIEFIKKTVDLVGLKNLRTIRFTLDNFGIIFKSLADDFFGEHKWLQDNRKNILRSLFVFNLIISNEYRGGKIKNTANLEELLGFTRSKDAINRYLNTDSTKALNGIINTLPGRELAEEYQQENQNGEDYITSFVKTYLGGGFHNKILRDNYEYYFSVGSLIIDGVIRKDELENEIRRLIPIKSEGDSALNVLRNYRLHEIDELRNATDLVIHHIKEVNFSAGLLPSIYLAIDEIKDYICVDMKDIFLLMKDVIWQAFDRHGEHNSADLYFDSYFDENIKDEKYQDLSKLVKNTRKVYLQKDKLGEVEAFLSSLGTDEMDNTYRSISYEPNLFSLINKTTFNKRIVKLSNISIMSFNSFVKERYLNLPNANEIRGQEYEHIKEFDELLKQEIEGTELDKLKGDILRNLVLDLDKTLSHIEKGN